MKIKYYTLSLLAAAALLPLQVLAQNAKPFVVPELTSWQGGEGKFSPSGRIVLASKSKALRSAADALAADYQQMFGQRLQLVSGRAQAGDIVFALSSDSSLGEEGYQLDIRQQTTVRARTAQGAYWATRTLLQLSEQDAQRQLPQGSTTDIPQYALRGFMLDVGRKYIPIDYLRQLVKVLAYYKMNTLQLHLNDNGFKQYFGNDWAKTSAAFRLESTTFPGLAPKGASYSKREFIDLQLQAEAQHVDIIPEIDVPAHTLAFAHYRPELASKDQGDDHLDIFNPKTYEFIDALFREYLAGPNPVFRSKHFNIGTDEYSNATEELREKFRAFTDRYVRYVESFGKQAYLWGSLKHAYGKTPVKLDKAVVLAWSRDFLDASAAHKEGQRLVSIPDGYTYIVPAAGYYYDYLDTKLLYDKYTPALMDRSTRFEEQDSCILGGMFAVWNDHYGNGISVKDIHHRIMHALPYMALKTWTAGKTAVPYETMQRLSPTLSEAPGVHELGLWAKGEQREVLHLERLQPGAKLGAKLPEIGYDYSVSFTVEPREEAKGTVLLSSPTAKVYLSDPRQGLLGFARDGYLNTFRYRLPQSGSKVTITIEGDNEGTSLYVDGRLRERLSRQTLYAQPVGGDPALRLDQQYEAPDKFAPEVYQVPQRGRMFYVRTLVFPLEEAGQFKSTVTDLRVLNYKPKR